MSSRRRKAREIALQTLYAAYIGDSDWERALSETLSRRGSDGEAAQYAERLVRGVWASRETLDERIAKHLKNWKLERVSVVDRIILEIALYELLECVDVPKVVIMDEAIEIAHHFSSEKAGAFVNGILDKLAGEVRRD
jgi:N utilization substance protein B